MVWPRLNRPFGHILKTSFKTGAGLLVGAICGMGIQPQTAPDYMAMGEIFVDVVHLIPWQPGYARITVTDTLTREPYNF